ncbi:hypothetical protein [Persephonella sp.]|nr:hypothetical protein [Persephonella sp.]
MFTESKTELMIWLFLFAMIIAIFLLDNSLSSNLQTPQVSITVNF